MKKFIGLTLLGLSLVSGCANPQQVAAEKQAQINAQNEADDTTCRSYGLSLGTTGYVDCREQLQGQEAQAAEERQQERAEIASAYIAAHPYVPPAPAPEFFRPIQPMIAPVTTSCNSFGSQTTCQSQ